MPTTYNGIGTHYYGRRNKDSRPGVCPNCQKAVDLQSYDTRLWFVVIFVPIIPLKRKRVIDSCPKCSVHRVMDLKEWEELKAREISEGMASIKSSPDDPDAAITLHGRLVAYGQRDQADELARVMESRFPKEAKVQAYLGSVLQYLGRGQESLAYYRKALELDPDLSEAKIVVGLQLADEGRLDEARDLLRFLEEPEGKSDPGVLFALGVAYQKAERHEEALELFTHLSGRFPEIAQDKNFRKAVKQSESQVTSWQSKLPPRQRNLKPLFTGMGIALIVVAIAWFSNHQIQNGRALHVANGYDEPVTVSIGAQDPVTVRAGALVELKIPEGGHEATIDGAIREVIAVNIRSSFWKRWFDERVFVLNPGGAALLYQEETIYSSRAVDDTVGNYRLMYGRPFEVLSGIDYPFVPFPDSIEVSNSSRSLRKTRVAVADFSADTAFWSLVRDERLGEAVKLGEWHLRLHPEDTSILPALAGIAEMNGRSDEIETLIDEAVARRPVEVDWHRFYQQMNLGPAVTAEYDALLKADPEDSNLHYLRGRLSPSRQEARKYFQEALRLESSNVYAHFAIAYNHASGGDWAEAEASVIRAMEMRPDEPQYEESLFESRMARGLFAEFEAELREKLADEPLSFPVCDRLMIVLIAQGKTDECDSVAAEFEQLLSRPENGGTSAEIDRFQARVRYLNGDLTPVELEDADEFENLAYRFQLLVEAGDPVGASALLGPEAEELDVIDVLACSIAWHEAGRLEEASTWRVRATELLGVGQDEYQIAGEMLGQPQGVPSDEAMDLSLQAHEKAVWLVALAQQFPDQSEDFLSLARSLNVARAFPYHLLDRVTKPSTTGTTLL